MSTIKVDTVRPVTADASLTLQGDNSGTGVSGITIDSSGNATFAGTSNNLGTVTAGTISGGTIGSSVVFPALGELYLYADGGSPVTFALNSTDSFVIFIWAQNDSDKRIANEYGTLVAGTFTEVLNFTGSISWSYSNPNLTITVGSGYTARIAQVFRVG